MSLMQWDDSMSVGVPELDSQHKVLIDLVNKTFKAIQKHDEHEMATLLLQMQEYAAQHFLFEEACMEKHGFPDLESHRKMHHAFNIKVAAFRQELYSRTNFSQIFIFLSRWLTDHIMKEDMKYTEYIPQGDS